MKRHIYNAHIKINEPAAEKEDEETPPESPNEFLDQMNES